MIHSALQTIAQLLFKRGVSFPVKGINFVPKIVSIWLGKRNISVLVYRFRITTIYIFLYIVFIYVGMNLLIFMFTNIKFKIYIFYKPKC